MSTSGCLPMHPPPPTPDVTVGGHNKETAEDFFKRVQDSTGTLVLWPSRLKIGAKSKKGEEEEGWCCVLTL